MVIEAIQTRYKGYHFRNRLEARWAVFFDVAKIKWEYEPEGYAVDGIPYLPGFYLPELPCYFEVKGQPEYDLNFLRRFADEVGCRVAVAEGQIPDPDEWSCLDTIGLQVLRPQQAGAPGDYVDDVAWGYRACSCVAMAAIASA